MATIFGGEQFKNIIRVDDTSVPTTGVHTFYQVPAGRWAKVEVEYAQAYKGFGGSRDLSTLLFGTVPFSDSNVFENTNGVATGILGDTWLKTPLVVSGNNAAVSGPVEFILLSGETVSDGATDGVTGTILKMTIREYSNPV